jgi:hypothetical protein
MCGSGVTASVVLLALHRVGIVNARIYDGSWSEWVRIRLRPMSASDKPVAVRALMLRCRARLAPIEIRCSQLQSRCDIDGIGAAVARATHAHV